ncbi:hypothetical protein [Oceanobacillus profundus]|nr:hypothetical protein [Oceanobacillus profundus]
MDIVPILTVSYSIEIEGQINWPIIYSIIQLYQSTRSGRWLT